MTLLIDAIDISNPVLLPPDLNMLSTQSLTGTGAFDVLMKTTKLHLKEEYNEGRITGEEYATVYLGALTAVMQQSVTYLANHQNEAKVRAEIGLIRQKTATELAQTDDTIPVGLGFNATSAVEGLVKSQLDLNALQEGLVTAQVTKSERDGVLVGQQIITELAQTDNIIGTTASAYGVNDSANITGVVQAQIDKLAAEQDLITQKLVTEVSQTSNIKPVDLGQMSTTIDIDGLAKSQREKVDQETILLAQKAITELAQTADAVDISTPALNTQTGVSGVISLQKDLFAAQTEGFYRDAEQKLSKMLIDAWSVDVTVREVGSANSTNKLSDTYLGNVLTKAMAGIGV